MSSHSRPDKVDCRPERRAVLRAGCSVGVLALAGCLPKAVRPSLQATSSEARFERIYGPIPDEKFPIPAVNPKHFDRRFMRTEVDFDSDEPVGTVIVDTQTFFLHLIGENGRAMRYGVGLGRQGFEWSGRGHIAWKRAWPKWTPPNEMIAREPKLKKYSAANGGMAPGLGNPLGARALYIFQNGKDTLYRLHGTPHSRSIGKAVSSGCVRLLNHDVIDLYERSTPNAKILVV